MGLRTRVAFASLCVGLLAISALDAYLGSTLRDELAANTSVDLERAARLIADQLRERAREAKPMDEGALAAFVQRTSEVADARVTLVSATGAVIADSSVPRDRLRSLDNHATRPEVATALASKVGRSERLSPTLREPMLYVAIASEGAGPVRVVRIAWSLVRVEAVVGRARWLLFAGTALALAVALAASWLMARFTTRSLSELTDVARSMAAGDYGRRAHVKTYGDIGALAEAMNRLAEELGQSVGRLEEERDLLTAILDGLEEGVLVVGPDARVLRVNPALGRSLGVGVEAHGLSVIDATRLPDLADSIAQCLEQTAVVSRELALLKPPRTLLVVIAPLPTGRGAVALFHDISAIRRLEAVRRDFVSNVSHELRTPVTALRAAAETLLAGAMNDPERATTFLGVIHRHAERLSRLISDLLDLSRLESGQMKLKSEAVPLARAADAALEVVLAQARDKRLTLEANLDGLTCRGDLRAVEQVLVNLLDNAVKYTPHGGHVSVRGEDLGKVVRVRVTDSGPGIDPEHLARVFERFYRVDAGRSREVGGTGLGLAIVKHLVEVMGGEVRANSVLGEGSTFSFTLPSSIA
jgi:two-component system phosphate regulon sensor histidine kinase PhoR